MRGDAGGAHPRRPGQPVQPRLHLPQGLDPQAAARGPRSAARPADPPGRRSGHRHLGRGQLGRGLRRDRAGSDRGARRPRARRGGPVLRQPVGPHAVGRALQPHRGQGPRARATCSRPAPSTRCPSTCRAACSSAAPLLMPVPDLDRTDHLLMLGANPWESNGSLCTAPDFPGRVKAIQARGGKVVVVDPRRTRTAEEADEHVAIRPGTDAHLLVAMIQVLFDEDLVDPGAGRTPPARRRRGAPSRGRLHPRGGGRPLRRRRRRHPPPGPRGGGRPHRRRLRPHRHPHRRVRHGGGLGGRRAQRPDRQPRPARRASCSRWPPTTGADRPGPGPGLRPRSPHAAGSRASARSRASSRWPPWPTRSRRPARARCAP